MGELIDRVNKYTSDKLVILRLRSIVLGLKDLCIGACYLLVRWHVIDLCIGALDL